MQLIQKNTQYQQEVKSSDPEERDWAQMTSSDTGTQWGAPDARSYKTNLVRGEDIQNSAESDWRKLSLMTRVQEKIEFRELKRGSMSMSRELVRKTWLTPKRPRLKSRPNQIRSKSARQIRIKSVKRENTIHGLKQMTVTTRIWKAISATWKIKNGTNYLVIQDFKRRRSSRTDPACHQI